MRARATLLNRRWTIDMCARAKGATRCSAVHSLAIWLVCPSPLATQEYQKLLPDGTDVTASVAYL